MSDERREKGKALPPGRASVLVARDSSRVASPRCGCSAPPTAGGKLRYVQCRVRPKGKPRMLLAEYVVTNVAVCLACPASQAEREGGPKLRCGESGERFELHARAGQQAAGKWPCPRGKHADERGRVVALTVAGLPVKTRGVAWWTRKRLVKSGVYPGAMKLPGCGCIDVLKGAWEWLIRTGRPGATKAAARA